MKEKLTIFWAKINALFLFLTITLPQYSMVTFARKAQTSSDFTTKFNNLIDEYSTEIAIVLSVGMLLSIAIFIFHCVQLNNHASNPQARKQDITNLLVTGICLAAQGSVSIILAIIYFAFG